jgi:hypothetical protein
MITFLSRIQFEMQTICERWFTAEFTSKEDRIKVSNIMQSKYAYYEAETKDGHVALEHPYVSDLDLFYGNIITICRELKIRITSVSQEYIIDILSDDEEEHKSSLEKEKQEKSDHETPDSPYKEHILGQCKCEECIEYFSVVNPGLTDLEQ